MNISGSVRVTFGTLPNPLSSPLFACYLDLFSVMFAFVYSSDNIKDHPIPAWALQEVSHSPVTTNMLETWFPQSDQSGVSSNLMESLRYGSWHSLHFLLNVHQNKTHVKTLY